MSNFPSAPHSDLGEKLLQSATTCFPYTPTKVDHTRRLRAIFGGGALVLLGLMWAVTTPYYLDISHQRSSPASLDLCLLVWLLLYGTVEYLLAQSRKISVTLDDTSLHYREAQGECRLEYTRLTHLEVEHLRRKGVTHQTLILHFAPPPPVVRAAQTRSATQRGIIRPPLEISPLRISLDLFVPAARLQFLHALLKHAPQATTNALLDSEVGIHILRGRWRRHLEDEFEP